MYLLSRPSLGLLFTWWAFPFKSLVRYHGPCVISPKPQSHREGLWPRCSLSNLHTAELISSIPLHTLKLPAHCACHSNSPHSLTVRSLLWAVSRRGLPQNGSVINHSPGGLREETSWGVIQGVLLRSSDRRQSRKVASGQVEKKAYM